MADLMEGMVLHSNHLTRRSSCGSLSSSLICVNLSDALWGTPFCSTLDRVGLLASKRSHARDRFPCSRNPYPVPTRWAIVCPLVGRFFLLFSPRSLLHLHPRHVCICD